MMYSFLSRSFSPSPPLIRMMVDVPGNFPDYVEQQFIEKVLCTLILADP